MKFHQWITQSTQLAVFQVVLSAINDAKIIAQSFNVRALIVAIYACLLTIYTNSSYTSIFLAILRFV